MNHHMENQHNSDDGLEYENEHDQDNDHEDRHEELAHCIQRVPIFNHMDQETIGLLADYAHPIFLRKGELLYRSGEESNCLYVVHIGRVNVYQLSPDGKEQLMRILRPGDFTGEFSLFVKGSMHEDFAEAMQDSHICELRHEDVQKILSQYPAVAMKVLEEISRRLMQAQNQVSKVATVSISQRLSMYLVSLIAEDEQDHDGEVVVTLPMSRKELASYLGTSPESISRKFKDLEELELIEQVSTKKIRLLDIEGLQEVVD